MGYKIKGNTLNINDGEYVIEIADEVVWQGKGIMERAYYRFSFWANGEQIVEGSGERDKRWYFSPSPSRDELAAFMGAIASICVNGGDGVDDEFFDHYTPRQKQWIGWSEEDRGDGSNEQDDFHMTCIDEFGEDW